MWLPHHLRKWSGMQKSFPVTSSVFPFHFPDPDATFLPFHAMKHLAVVWAAWHWWFPSRLRDTWLSMSLFFWAGPPLPAWKMGWVAFLTMVWWFSVTVAGGVLSPLELCDVNGDGLPDILVVFTALMNASVRGKHRSSFPFLFLYMSVQTFVCLMHGNSSCLCKST